MHVIFGLCWYLDFLFNTLHTALIHSKDARTAESYPCHPLSVHHPQQQHRQSPLTQSSDPQPTSSIKRSYWLTADIASPFLSDVVIGWLTAKCGSRSTWSASVNPTMSTALGRWSTTACSDTPLPRPLQPLPRALRAPRPRAWTPRPLPDDRIPLLAAWVKTTKKGWKEL